MNQSTPGVVPLRSRGRPPKTAADQETLKTRIVDATLQAFAEHGYRNMTVEHILLNAGISRPTFYKYFPQLEEPLALAAARINHDLLACIKQALQSANDPIMAATAACHAYIDWGIKLGKVLQPLYAEFYETSSPISRYRLQSIAGIQDMVYEALACSGRPRPSEALMGLFITGIEYLAFQFLLHSDRSATALTETQLAMFRLLICSFGQPEDFKMLM